MQQLQAQRSDFLRSGPPSAAVRRDRIDRLILLLTENADEFADALCTDFGNRPRVVNLLSDIAGILPDLTQTRRRLDKWMRPQRVWSSRRGRPADRHRQEATRRRRRHGAVELPHRVGCRADGVRDGRRKPRDDQVLRGHSANRGGFRRQGGYLLRPKGTHGGHRWSRGRLQRSAPCHSITSSSPARPASARSSPRRRRRTSYR